MGGLGYDLCSGKGIRGTSSRNWSSGGGVRIIVALSWNQWFCWNSYSKEIELSKGLSKYYSGICVWGFYWDLTDNCLVWWKHILVSYNCNRLIYIHQNNIESDKIRSYGWALIPFQRFYRVGMCRIRIPVSGKIGLSGIR